MTEQERMAEVSDWLATDEGHAWLDSQAAPWSAHHGLTFGPWISVKGDETEREYAARWWPRNAPLHTSGWAEHVDDYIATHPDAVIVEHADDAA